MNNFIHELEINNFKSIQHLKMDCKRVNVFIGKPNVGKSNILEALALLGAHYSTNPDKILSEFIRYEEISNLFYDDDLLLQIQINTNLAKAVLRFHVNAINAAELAIGDSDWIRKIFGNEPNIINSMNIFLQAKADGTLGRNQINLHYVPISSSGREISGGESILKAVNNPIKKYQFKPIPHFENKFPSFLLPPHGSNLFTITHHNKSLRKEICLSVT